MNIVLVAAMLAPNASIQAPKPPQAPPIQEIGFSWVITQRIDSLEDGKRVDPKPTVKKKAACYCSEACTCGCQEGLPCGCKVTPVQKAPVIQYQSIPSSYNYTPNYTPFMYNGSVPSYGGGFRGGFSSGSC